MSFTLGTSYCSSFPRSAWERIRSLEQASTWGNFSSHRSAFPRRAWERGKTLTKHGNSLALAIEMPVLELLGADAETPFDVTTDGQVLILSPIKDADRSEAFSKALDRVNAITLKHSRNWRNRRWSF